MANACNFYPFLRVSQSPLYIFAVQFRWLVNCLLNPGEAYLEMQKCNCSQKHQLKLMHGVVILFIHIEIDVPNICIVLSGIIDHYY